MPKKSISLLQLNDILRDLEERNKRNWDAVYDATGNDAYYVGYNEAISNIRKQLLNLRVYQRGFTDDKN